MRLFKVVGVCLLVGVFVYGLLSLVAPLKASQLRALPGKFLTGVEQAARNGFQQAQTYVQGLGLQVGQGADSVVGAPTISADFIDRVLSAYGSPAAGTGQSLYDLGVQYGIDPAYALAFFLHESSFGKAGRGAANHSLGNIRCTAGYSCQDGFRYYVTWQDSYQDWYNLILNGYVKGTVSSRCPCTTIEQIVPVYAPSSDGNNEAAYIAAVLNAIRAWRAGNVYV